MSEDKISWRLEIGKSPSHINPDLGKDVEIDIVTPDEQLIGKRVFVNEDPYFTFDHDDFDYDIWRVRKNETYDPYMKRVSESVAGSIEVSKKKYGIERGYKIKVGAETVMRNVIAAWYYPDSIMILAPKQISPRTGDEDYPTMHDPVSNKYIGLRPGATIIGGRNSGFYDNVGLIVQAEYTGGSRDKFEDWAYKILYRQRESMKLKTSWILLDEIGFIDSVPDRVTKFATYDNANLDNLLKDSEYELYDYFIKHPEKLDSIHPKQFEGLVASVYKNMGFSVEPVGAWNQADGGVDIIAVSKTFTGFEYKLAIQCKMSKNKISAKPIRELAGVLGHEKLHQGVVATTSSFTTNAIREKEGYYWNIDLVDREILIDRMVELLIKEDSAHAE